MLQVGLVGAGPWAQFVHGPTLAAGPETQLSGIWARRPDAARSLAERLGVPVFERYEALLEVSEAMSFAVPPEVQAAMGATAATAGKAVLLEKPIAADMASARRLVEVIEAAGVVSQLVLSWRYAAGVRTFLDDAAALEPIGGRAAFVSGVRCWADRSRRHGDSSAAPSSTWDPTSSTCSMPRWVRWSTCTRRVRCGDGSASPSSTAAAR